MQNADTSIANNLLGETIFQGTMSLKMIAISEMFCEKIIILMGSVICEINCILPIYISRRYFTCRILFSQSKLSVILIKSFSHF